MKIHAKTQRQRSRGQKEKGTFNHTSSLRFSLRFATPRQDAVAGERHEKRESNFILVHKTLCTCSHSQAPAWECSN